MKKYLKLSLVGLLVVAIAGITAVGVVYAQGDPPRPHEALAELLGLTEDELRDQIRDGITLEELAEAAGVDLDEFWQTIKESRAKYHQDRIQQALENGDITEDQYNWMLEGFESGFMGGGRGPGGFHGRGSFGNEDGTRLFGGREGFGGQGKSFGDCGMGRFNK